MRLAAFIEHNTKPIIEQWETFARTLVSSSSDMTPLALRNHIQQILDFVVCDIQSPQTEDEQKAKSEGNKPKKSSETAAEIHASLRQSGGFNLSEMAAEFRALRASVIHLWRRAPREDTELDIEDLIRFNESIDQELTESLGYYSEKRELSHDLFLGIISHDLRNPISSMMMSAKLLTAIGELNQRQTPLASQIIASGDRAMTLLDHLVDLARARLGPGLGIIKEEMDFAFVGRQLADEVRTTHPDRIIKLEVSGQTEGKWDKPRIGQVFSNLLGNALAYGFRDTPIRVTIAGEATEVLLSIHNDGVPIPSDSLSGIFDPLNRGSKADEKTVRSKNLGLGLFITNEIVIAHGGTIDVTSSEKEGTTFTAHFPR